MSEFEKMIIPVIGTLIGVIVGGSLDIVTSYFKIKNDKRIQRIRLFEKTKKELLEDCLRFKNEINSIYQDSSCNTNNTKKFNNLVILINNEKNLKFYSLKTLLPSNIRNIIEEIYLRVKEINKPHNFENDNSAIEIFIENDLKKQISKLDTHLIEKFFYLLWSEK